MAFGLATPPAAQDDTAATAQGMPVSVNVLANDSDDGTPRPLAIVSVGQPKAGTAVTNAGQILYAPNSNFLGDDSFAYTISDGQSTATAIVRVSVFFADGTYWFPFNQTSGLTTEEAGGGTTGSLIGFTNDPTQWVTGRFNRALQFDGVSNEVVINGFKGILGTNPRAISAWVKTTASGNSHWNRVLGRSGLQQRMVLSHTKRNRPQRDAPAGRWLRKRHRHHAGQ